MNIEALSHIMDSQDAYALSNKKVQLRLRTAKNDFDKVSVIYGIKYEFSQSDCRYEAILEKRFLDKLYDYYIVDINLHDNRLAYIFKLEVNGDTYYYSEDGISCDYDFNLAYYTFFQLAYINQIDIHKKVDWLDEAVFYQIFIDRFKIGKEKQNKDYINLKWGDIPTSKSFAGGDLYGIAENIDYILSLGVNCIYLTPTFTAPSNHKYDTHDYYNVDSQFGGNKALKSLIELAHSKGLRIVLDAVFNHCGEGLKEWQDVVKNGKKSPYYNWFMIDGEYPNYKEENYEVFASCYYMPKFNTSNVQVQKYLIDIAKYYTKELKIDGWRLDVSDEVSHEFWRLFRKEIKAVNEDIVIIGENWHNASSYLSGDQYDSIMNYAFTKAMLDYFVYNNFDAQGLKDKLCNLWIRNTDMVNFMMMNLLDCHDTHRFLSLCKGDISKLKMALAILFFYPGAPMIYYGTEIAMLGGYDPDSRRTFDWTKANNPILSKQIKYLTDLKKSGRLSSGLVEYGAENGVFIIRRIHKAFVTTLYVNNTTMDKTINEGKIKIPKQDYKIVF